MASKKGDKDIQGKDQQDRREELRERELVMKVTKEIVVKFIEMGKVTPASFDEIFSAVHQTVRNSMERS